MILKKYKMLLPATPFPFETGWIVATNLKAAIKKAKWQAKRMGLKKIGSKPIEYEQEIFDTEKGMSGLGQTRQFDPEKEVKVAVEKHFPLSKKVIKMISMANFDLYYGPSGISKDYPGFTKAIDYIADALDNVSDIYVNIDTGEVLESEPEAWFDEEMNEWVEPYWEGWYEVDRKQVLEMLVGKELASYIY